MLVRLYEFLWILFAASAILLFAAGYMTPIAVVLYGFIAFGMVFMGMISLLPATSGHNAQAPAENPEPVIAQTKAAPARLPESVRA